MNRLRPDFALAGAILLVGGGLGLLYAATPALVVQGARNVVSEGPFVIAGVIMLGTGVLAAAIKALADWHLGQEDDRSDLTTPPWDREDDG